MSKSARPSRMSRKRSEGQSLDPSSHWSSGLHYSSKSKVSPLITHYNGHKGSSNRRSNGHSAIPVRLWDEPLYTADDEWHVRDELLPAVQELLKTHLSPSEYDAFLSYNMYWHPRCPEIVRKAFSKFYCNSTNQDRCRLISPNALTRIVFWLRAQTQVLGLLSDRGPDYGLTLLMLLDIVFQIAFCMRRVPVNSDNTLETKRNMSIITVHSPRLLEVLSLHLDCSPLAPHFLTKFLLTCEGFLYHRKIPSACLSRFYQLQHFLAPQSRAFLFEAPARLSTDSSTYPTQSFLPQPLMEVVERKLWDMARTISLGRPSAEAKRALRKQTHRSLIVASHLDAMAIVFERLNHLAKAIFGAPICSYGSAATGFATVHSDVDVVLQLGESGVKVMMAHIKRVRELPDGVDLNPFPSKTLGGFTQAIGDWSWVDEKDPSVAASIWAGRLFAWGIHRLYGWHVQCVQSAYVPIVRVLGCVSRQGMPMPVPEQLRPLSSIEANPTAATQIILSHTRHIGGEFWGEDVSGIRAEMDACLTATQRQMAAKVAAVHVVAEAQYASWTPTYDFSSNPSIDSPFSSNATSPVGVSPSKTGAQAVPLTPESCAQFLIASQTVELEAALLDIFAPCVKAVLAYAPVRSPGLASPIKMLKPGWDDGRLTPVSAKTGAMISRGGSFDDELWLVEADFSADRQVGIHNSRLLRAYASCSPYVVALGLLVKHWAKTRGMGDAYAGYLSGYQWTLLVIHYLQHFFCVKPPPAQLNSPDFQQLSRQFKQAGVIPTPLQYLPLLANLQHLPNDHDRLIIHEMEGPVDVSFYQPGIGKNRNLPHTVLESCRDTPLEEPVSPHQHPWPEEKLLSKDPLSYAYTQLTPPFDLEPLVEAGLSNKASQELWNWRVKTAPRPGEMRRGKTGDVMSYRFWDIRRRTVKERLDEALGADPPMLVSFPCLDPIRSKSFIKNHIMVKGHLLMPFDESSLTLVELLYGFFEYYGLRFNFATDMADIDRVPKLPRGKKEFFETALFEPKLLPMPAFPAEGDTKIQYPVVSESESKDSRNPPGPVWVPITTQAVETEDLKKVCDDGSTSPDTHSQTTAAKVEVPVSPHAEIPSIIHATEDLPLDTAGDGDIPQTPQPPLEDPPVDCDADASESVGGAPPEDLTEEDDDEDPRVSEDVVEDDSHVAPHDEDEAPIEAQHHQVKEVVGRGNGPYQYKGRHFLCILDPFEKLRTIGPPCRCQSHISTELMSALQLFGRLRSELVVDGTENAEYLESLLDQLFQTQHRAGRLWHPAIESLGQLLSDMQAKMCEVTSPMDLPYVDYMQPSLVNTVMKNGKYKAALDAFNRRMAERPKKQPPAKKYPEATWVKQTDRTIEDAIEAALPPRAESTSPVIMPRRFDVDVSRAPPGFEEVVPQRKKSVDLRPVIEQVLDADTKKEVAKHFSQCPHFTLNFGEMIKNTSAGVTQGWRYSKEAVETLKEFPVCTCHKGDETDIYLQPRFADDGLRDNVAEDVGSSSLIANPPARPPPPTHPPASAHPPPPPPKGGDTKDPAREASSTKSNSSKESQRKKKKRLAAALAAEGPDMLNAQWAKAEAVVRNISPHVSHSHVVGEQAGVDLLRLINPEAANAIQQNHHSHHRHQQRSEHPSSSQGDGMPTHLHFGGGGRGGRPMGRHGRCAGRSSNRHV
eukprot:Blabericola_migrator_1__173@NODE_1046_length_5613_cov_107_348539_g720_i0_p1_GENE_NODE_1046_length_5613_cov_107_348539_g720_i0NODE_1046_length_5613_cov_107_348539_g720_i0_p1_ORF_typecomplete_len1669_score297_36PAP_assoc/PF03828_19/2_2e05PAP_assoc/PF03828_19/11PAP_central/PF04928_17/2e05NTP_transf_2/PF01909_23/0_022Nrap_D2/PF17403_2/0_13_NODE_1046_length_5613_cov_107_348539_g720_i03115317